LFLEEAAESASDVTLYLPKGVEITCCQIRRKGHRKYRKTKGYNGIWVFFACVCFDLARREIPQQMLVHRMAESQIPRMPREKASTHGATPKSQRRRNSGWC
jgi:hypothetical protein